VHDIEALRNQGLQTTFSLAVWLLYLGHFSLVPEPPKPAQIDGDDAKKAAQYGHLLVCNAR
jgi:hypothetical protein